MKWVDQQPTETAVRDASTNLGLTYRQLWQQSGQLADQLRAHGVRRGDFVGVALPRSVNLIVGLVGIIRMGAAYLPIDMQAPADRAEMMLDDADVRVVLAGEAALQWPLPAGVSHLEVPTLTTSDDAGESAHLTVDVPDDSPAYVAYTSGSTGKPKGVVIPHRAVVRLVTAANYHTISPGDRVANSSNPAFDAMTFEVWSTLTAGGTIVVLPTLTDLPLDRWVEMIRAERITTMFLTSALFHMVAREQPTAFRTVETLMVGGEQLDLVAAREVLTADPSRRILNLYGPTETTTFATFFECTLESIAGLERGPIGFPLQDTRLYVLDENLDPVLPGEPGELCIGGPGVALGYLRRPELTSEKFASLPDVDRAGTLYRTGDVVRELPNGALEMLGRRDRQVKLRGFRIELDEIERAAVDTGLARAAFVEKRGEGLSSTLVGFVLPEPAGSVERAELPATLSAELAKRLPTYMIPARWNVLAALPVSRTGKVDRAALLAHVQTPAPAAEATVNNHDDPPEMTGLREIWCGVLGVPQIPNGASFLELGGNSILAIQTVYRARNQLDIELEPTDVLRSTSLADLASRARSSATVSNVENAAAPDADTIKKVIGSAPLSLAQERLWFLQTLFPSSAEYNVPVVVRLRGRLKENSLRRALAAVVERQSILRSRVSESSDGRLAIATDSASPIRVTLHDLANANAGGVDQVLEVVTATPFDLTAGPAWRVDLLRLGSKEHLLALTLHHLIFDGWSVGVLMRELDLCYAAFDAGEIPTLPALPIQYGDFARWQRDPAKDLAREAQVAFWRDRLRGAPVLQLPIDGASPSVRSGPGRGVPFTLPQEVAQGVLRLSRQRGTTPFATLLAAFQALLARHTGQHDLSVAVPMAGRTRTETKDLIGFFVNTQVLRSQVANDASFTDLLDHTQNSLIEGLGHQDAPFERIVEELRPDRDLNRNPLAQVLFGARDPLPAFTAGGLSADRYEWGQGSAGFDLAVEIEASSDGIKGRIEFPRGLFEEATVRGLISSYQSILTAVAADPQTRIGELPLGDEAALRQIIANGTGEIRPIPDRLLHELLSDRAAAWPTATALEWEGGRLSFAQLQTRAEEVATGLRADGAGPGDVIAVLLPRGPELVAAILGVLQVGAAYLPIDPGQPRGRLELLLADVKASFALTDQQLAARLDGLPVQFLLMDRPVVRTTIVRPVAGSPEQLAYLIFTSGSTGRPKPVAVPHRALVNHALAMADLFELQPSDRVLQFASAGFDVFAEEVFPTLLAGARVIFPPSAGRPGLSVAEFEKTVQLAGVTLVNLPSSFWAQWAKEMLAGGRQPSASLRQVVIGSEQVDGRLLERWRRHTRVPVANVYGVSEATVSTIATMQAAPTASSRVPVGRAISNTQAIVLDVAMQPLPSGVTGELCIGGLGVAQGYLDRPELTAERFLPNPYGPPGSRLYRTGDLARWLPSGSLELIGRVDGQLKIRGHRIEPGEIESRLAEHPGILQAAVNAQADAQGAPSLVGYLVCIGAAPGLAELRHFLRERLPESMVPAAFVVLERLPLTANGKVDRAALPAAEASRLTGVRTYRAPSTGTELALVEIWCELLGLESVGVDDDFFELGGHSLLATQVVSRMRERLSRELPLRSIFEHPTIAALAKVLDTATPAATHPAGPTLRRACRASYRIAASQLDPRVTVPDTSHPSGVTSHVAS